MKWKPSENSPWTCVCGRWRLRWCERWDMGILSLNQQPQNIIPMIFLKFFPNFDFNFIHHCHPTTISLKCHSRIISSSLGELRCGLNTYSNPSLVPLLILNILSSWICINICFNLSWYYTNLKYFFQRLTICWFRKNWQSPRPRQANEEKLFVFQFPTFNIGEIQVGGGRQDMMREWDSRKQKKWNKTLENPQKPKNVKMILMWQEDTLKMISKKGRKILFSFCLFIVYCLWRRG